MKNKQILIIILTLLTFTFLRAYDNKLNVFNWIDYIDPAIVQEFEDRYECDVVEGYFDSQQNMLSKLQGAKASYDLVCPSSDQIPVMKESGLLEKLDKDILTNWRHLDPKIIEKQKMYKDADDYSMPYFWGVTGLLYNSDYVTFADENLVSWTIFANVEYKDKLMMLDDAREVVGAALIATGSDVNDYSEQSLLRAQKILKVWDKNIAGYHYEEYKKEISSSKIWIAQAYNGDALRLVKEYPNLKFSLMKEGSTFRIDSFVMLKNAENRDMAYKFLNFLMEPEIAARNASWVEYPTPNKTAYDNFVSEEEKNNEVIYISEDYLNRSFPIKYLGDNVVSIRSMYEKICLNSGDNKRESKRRSPMIPIAAALFVAVLLPMIRRKKGKNNT